MIVPNDVVIRLNHQHTADLVSLDMTSDDLGNGRLVMLYFMEFEGLTKEELQNLTEEVQEHIERYAAEHNLRACCDASISLEPSPDNPLDDFDLGDISVDDF